MKLYIRQEYKASKKEPYGTMLRRIYEALAVGGAAVQYSFTFADHQVSGMVSSVARAVKKFPHLGPLVTSQTLPHSLRMKESEQAGPLAIMGDETKLDFPQLAEVADGLPRSLPFRLADVRFHTTEFGKGAGRGRHRERGG